MKDVRRDFVFGRGHSAESVYSLDKASKFRRVRR